MELSRRNVFAYCLLAAVWLLIIIWQVEEHVRVREAARTNLSNRSKDIANTVSACIRGMRFRGAIFQERLQPVLNELVHGRTNELVKSSELTSIVLVNASGEPVASAGLPVDLSQRDILQSGRRWGAGSVLFVNPVDLGTSLTSEGSTNRTVILPPMRGMTNPPPDRPREFQRREGPPPEPPTNEVTGALPPAHRDRPEPDGRRDGERRPRRPFWWGNLDESEFHSMMEKRALHGLVLAMSTHPYEQVVTRDAWLRSFIILLGGLAALVAGIAWRNLAKTSELQIRLVRASELNTHLQQMSLASAGLAHETRNPLNIIRGLAQMISKQSEVSPEAREKSRAIVDEADKVAAQLNEFINYSRPREVRRAVLPVGPLVSEVVRALNYDLQEKNIQLEIQCEQLKIEADEQLLRQALFNLLINAIQVVSEGGRIVVVAQRESGAGGVLEVRDDGPGVPLENRREIFKPYFTTHKQGTGLGLAVVQQIVHAHGWEIECAANEPEGAVFRIRHMKLVE